MKKILFIVNVDWYFKLHWLSRVQACQRAGYQVCLACQFSSESIRTEFESAGISCYPLTLARTSLNPLGELRSLVQMRRLLQQIDPDLVHSITVKANIYGGFNAVRRRLPLIATVAGRGWVSSDDGFKAGMINRILMSLYRFIFRHKNTRIIFENPCDRDYFVQNAILDKQQTWVIPGAGVDPARFVVTDLAEANAFNLLFASRLLKSKGLDTLVSACDLLRQKGRKIRLRVAGIQDESQADALPLAQIEKWAEAGKLEWLGQRDDMPDLIGESALVILPTRYGEGIPRILIEAAACGRAIVASNVSGCREIVDHEKNGLLVPPDASILDWAEAIDALLVDPERTRRMGLEGRRLVEAEFSDARICRETMELYTQALADR